MRGKKRRREKNINIIIRQVRDETQGSLLGVGQLTLFGYLCDGDDVMPCLIREAKMASF